MTGCDVPARRASSAWVSAWRRRTPRSSSPGSTRSVYLIVYVSRHSPAEGPGRLADPAPTRRDSRIGTHGTIRTAVRATSGTIAAIMATVVVLGAGLAGPAGATGAPAVIVKGTACTMAGS